MNACRLRLIALFSIPAILFTAAMIASIAFVIASAGNPLAIGVLAFIAFTLGLATMDLARRFLAGWNACRGRR